jgi:T5orf172 domain
MINKGMMMTETTTGIVYVLVNDAMPGLVKIGQTENLAARLYSLSNHSGVPLPFECHFAAKVKDYKSLESKLHKIFAPHRINKSREFFQMSPERVVLAISVGTYEDVTPTKSQASTPDEKEGLKALEKSHIANERRGKTLLSKLGIVIGSELTFSRDADIKATVIEGDKIEFEGKPTSLSAAALVALKRLHYKSTTANGAAYWMFEGELLTERRLRLEDARG